RIAPDNESARSNLAWLLGTAADPSVRNGSEVFVLDEQAESRGHRSANHAIVVRILAAAYPRVARFADRQKTAEQALQTEEAQGNSDLSAALRNEISLYDLGLPYHKQAR